MSDQHATSAVSTAQMLERLDELAAALNEDDPHFHLERNNPSEWEVCVFVRDYADSAVQRCSNEYGKYGYIETRSADRTGALAAAVRHCERIAANNMVVPA